MIAQSFGAVYTERPFTVGRGKYNLGVSFAKFSYDEMDGISLRDGDITLPRVSNAEPLALECAHFVECVKKRVQPRTSAV